MRNHNISYAAAIALLLLSCSKNNVDGPEPQEAKTKTVTVALVIDSVKTTLNPERTRLVWTDGDHIALKNNASSDVLDLTYQAGKMISVELPSAAKTVTAFYPYSMHSGIVVTKEQSQSEAGVLDPNRLPMTAAGTIAGGYVLLNFLPAAGVMAINIYKSENLAAGEKLKAVGIGSHILTLASPYSLAADSPADKRTFPGQVYVVLPRASYEAPTFAVETTSGLYTITISEGGGVDLINNDFYVLNIDLAKARFDEGEVIGENESFTDEPAIGLDGEYPEPKDVNIIPDFSTVGYHYGEVAPPVVAVGTVLDAPADGSDATALIQAAVDNCPSGKAVYLNAGTYNISGTIWIDRDNVVLRGAGIDNTVLNGTGTAIRNLVVVGSCGRKGSIEWDDVDHIMYSYGSAKTEGSWNIVDSLVPCGRWFVTVDSPNGLAVGDKIFVDRTPTQAWLDRIGPDGDEAWSIKGTTFRYSRVICKIVGKKIYLDAPITFQIEYGSGTVCKRSKSVNREVGIEDLTISSDYDPTVKSTVKDGTAGKLPEYEADENKMFSCISLGACENCWVRNVKGVHCTQSVVRMDVYSRKISVLNCQARQPISKITGSRRYAFHISGELCLVKDCVCENDRHAYVTYAWVEGPNAFVNCTSESTYGELGPHQRLSNGVLYDNVTTSYFTTPNYSYLGVLYASNTSGRSGHGWTGSNIVAWNCTAGRIRFYGQQADGIFNYAVGSTCTKPKRDAKCGRYGTLESLEDGCWYPAVAAGSSTSTKVDLNSVPAEATALSWWPQLTGSAYPSPMSLYECQLYERLNVRKLRFE